MNQLENCKLARRLWLERVKPEQVVSDLEMWRCGTQSCFGGHLQGWPEFQLMGVRRSEFGSPQMPHPDGQHPVMNFEVAEILFGNYTVFCARYKGEAPGKSDYDVVLERLDRQIARLESAITADNL